MGRRVMLIVVAAIVTLAIGVGVAFAASNAHNSNTNGGALAGPTWTLTRLEIDGKVGIPASARGAPTITFHSDGRFNGFSGCNTYGGKYALAGGRITVSDTAMTLMACINPDLTTDSDAMSFEADYMLDLGRITEYRVRGDTLTLRDSAGKVTMTFRRGA